jgi:DNA mismatch repair protein MutS
MNRMHAMSALLSILSTKRTQDYGVFSSARFDAGDSRRPGFSATGVWHPCLDYAHVIKNDVLAGRMARAPPGILLTGPNAGGKSTLLKSSLICVLLAQTLTIAPAAACHLTPFALINSHMNVPDCKGMASLFEAEMRRAKHYIDSVKALHVTNTAAFIVMDEIFSSTNPVEGMSGAYSVAKQLVKNDHCICIVSTHFTYLAKLSKDEPQSKKKLYSNWQMPVRISLKGDIEYPYQLRRGVCRQYIALDILERNGFDKDIIADAMSVKRDLLLGAAPKKINKLKEVEKHGEGGRGTSDTASGDKIAPICVGSTDDAGEASHE